MWHNEKWGGWREKQVGGGGEGNKKAFTLPNHLDMFCLLTHLPSPIYSLGDFLYLYL